MRLFSICRVLSGAAALAMAALCSAALADAPWSLTIDAGDYTRARVYDDSLAGEVAPDILRQRVRAQKRLFGQGWYEFDFAVPESGWYTVDMKGGAGDVDFFIDSNVHAYGQFHDRVLNAYLQAGKHTLRAQRLTWPSIDGFAGFTFRRAGGSLADSMRIDVASKFLALRKGETVDLDVYAGARTTASTLTAWVKDAKTDVVVKTMTLPIPATAAPWKTRLSIPCSSEGIYYVSFGEAGQPIDPKFVREIEYSVIDTSAHPISGQALNKTLITSIDCTAQAPDYSHGETSVMRSAAGAYRQSGDQGFEQSGKNYDFFAYRIDVPEEQKPYLVEVDYPDDAYRTFCLALMEKKIIDYPPVGGVDSGGTIPVSNRMQTQSFIHYPRGTELVLAVVNAQSGRKAAVSAIRVYRIDCSLPAHSAGASRPGMRDFGYWLEESDRWEAFNGAPDKSLSGQILSMDRWAQTARSMGVDVLTPTVAIYQGIMYPSAYFDGWFRPQSGPRDPMPLNYLRLLLLTAEKYGLKVIPEFHPTYNGYKRRMVDQAPYAADPAPARDLVVSRDGEYNDGAQPFRQIFNPIYPANQQWCAGLAGELGDQYGDSPALGGMSLRVMGWAGEGRWYWSSIYWGYDDYTIHLFEKETGTSVTVDDGDAKRFSKRYAWLMANAKQKWIDWRCGKITDLYRKIAESLRRRNPSLKLVSTIFGHVGWSADDNQLWDGTTDYREYYRGCGLDPDKLQAIPGVLLLNGISGYGRRETGRVAEQRGMDPLSDPQALASLASANGSTGFVFSNAYFEPDSTIDPHAMGLPNTNPGGWVAAVNPPGRQYLSRYIAALADADAALILDGGEGYLHGQPLLREFMSEYRSLPAATFTPRKDARDPVAVWQYKDGKNLWFYAVNREACPIRATFSLSGSGRVERASSDAAVALSGGRFDIDIEACQLLAFKASPALTIAGVNVRTPDSLIAKLELQVGWVAKALDETAANPRSKNMSPQSVANLRGLLADANASLAAGHTFRVRAILGSYRFLDFYNKYGQDPPGLFAGPLPQ